MSDEPIGADEDGLIYDLAGERALRRLRERQLAFITRTILAVIGDLDKTPVNTEKIKQTLSDARAVKGDPTVTKTSQEWLPQKAIFDMISGTTVAKYKIDNAEDPDGVFERIYRTNEMIWQAFIGGGKK